MANDTAKTPLSADDITSIVKQVISSLSGDITAADLKFYTELEELASYIRHAKQEILRPFKPKDISISIFLMRPMNWMPLSALRKTPPTRLWMCAIPSRRSRQLHA